MLRQVAGLGANFLPLSVAEWLAYWAAILVTWVQDSMLVGQMMQNCFPLSRQKLATSTHSQLIHVMNKFFEMADQMEQENRWFHCKFEKKIPNLHLPIAHALMELCLKFG